MDAYIFIVALAIFVFGLLAGKLQGFSTAPLNTWYGAHARRSRIAGGRNIARLPNCRCICPAGTPEPSDAPFEYLNPPGEYLKEWNIRPVSGAPGGFVMATSSRQDRHEARTTTWENDIQDIRRLFKPAFKPDPKGHRQ